MELSWPMKLRIAAALGVGVILIGILGWPLATPADPFSAVRAADIGLAGKMALMALAFFAGFIAYFLSWPYGREIGILAAPAGLAVWAVRCGSMASLMQQNPTVAERRELFAALKWEPIFWLVIVAAGFAGVSAGRKIAPQRETRDEGRGTSCRLSSPCLRRGKPVPAEAGIHPPSSYLNAAIALVSSVLIAQFFVGILARDARLFDDGLGSVVAQPAVGQIAFAVLVSFGIAAFVVKAFLNAGYIWPIIAGALVTGFAETVYLSRDVLQHLVRCWPAVFFSNSILSILPMQMVAFGTLGSIAGYWMAVRYNYWRKHEIR